MRRFVSGLMAAPCGGVCVCGGALLPPVRVNEMTPVCRRVTVIFTEPVGAARLHAAPWRSLASLA